jgi:Mn2+/Fe2+ NRAMP family transporter
MKVIMGVLGALTILAVALAFFRPGTPDPAYVPPAIWSGAGLAFVIALMGWMPIPLDVGVWHSLWTLERRHQTGHAPSVRHAVTDFNLGYGAATLMAILFLALGATLMYGSGEPTPEGSVAFAERVISLYRTSLGAWSVPIIGTAALVTMFSTTLAVVDGIPRVFQALAREFRGIPRGVPISRVPEIVSMAVLIAGSILVLSVMSERLTGLVDLATTLSFLTTPILAVFNLRLLTGPHTPAEARPRGRLLLLSQVSAAFLIGFALLFLYWRFFL